MRLRRFVALLLAVAAMSAHVRNVGRRVVRNVVGHLRRRRGDRSLRDVPLSPLTARWRIGRDWPERTGITTDVEPAGEMDDLAAFARPGFDPDRVAPLVRTFYERTADFDMEYAVRWHAPFRVGAALVAPLTTALEQLNLPGRSGTAGRLHGRFAAVRSDVDPRDGARAWVRTDAGGSVVFVAVYGSHEYDGERFVNIAVPLPRCNLSTVLRIDHLTSGIVTPGRNTGIRLHTRGDGDPGLYLSSPVGVLSLPMDQEFRVRTAPSRADADLLASHEMWLLGRQFLTVSYRIYARTSTS